MLIDETFETEVPSPLDNPSAISTIQAQRRRLQGVPIVTATARRRSLERLGLGAWSNRLEHFFRTHACGISDEIGIDRKGRHGDHLHYSRLLQSVITKLL